mgnify:CR=1 FL=1
MNNEMKFEKNGLLIPNGALEELGLVGISLSAWLGQDHILLMPQEMTALQLLHALEGLSQASVELLGVLQEACRMPCAGDCERDMDDVPQVKPVEFSGASGSNLIWIDLPTVTEFAKGPNSPV